MNNGNNAELGLDLGASFKLFFCDDQGDNPSGNFVETCSEAEHISGLHRMLHCTVNGMASKQARPNRG